MYRVTIATKPAPGTYGERHKWSQDKVSCNIEFQTVVGGGEYVQGCNVFLPSFHSCVIFTCLASPPPRARNIDSVAVGEINTYSRCPQGGLWGGLMVVVGGGGTLDFCLRTCVPFVKDCETGRTSVCVDG